MFGAVIVAKLLALTVNVSQLITVVLALTVNVSTLAVNLVGVVKVNSWFEGLSSKKATPSFDRN